MLPTWSVSEAEESRMELTRILLNRAVKVMSLLMTVSSVNSASPLNQPSKACPDGASGAAGRLTVPPLLQ